MTNAAGRSPSNVNTAGMGYASPSKYRLTEFSAVPAYNPYQAQVGGAVVPGRRDYCVSGWEALSRAASLRRGLMLAETLLRAGCLAAASQVGAAASALLAS